MAIDKNLEGLQWEEAEKQRGGRSVVPRVSIQRSGRIALNKQAVEDYITEKQYAKLFYEPNKRLIGIKPLSEPDENSYKIRVNEKYGSAAISAMAFLTQRDLWPESAIAFKPMWLDQEQMIVIDLDDPIASKGEKPEDTSGEDKNADDASPTGGIDSGGHEGRLT